MAAAAAAAAATTYLSDIPALDPLASGVDDNPAPAIVQGNLLQDADIEAANVQHQTRKRLSNVVQNSTSLPMATEGEVVASKRRKHEVLSANMDTAGTPLYVQNLQQQLQQMQQQTQLQLQQIQGQMQQMQGQMQQQIQGQTQQMQGQMQQMQGQMQQMQGQMQQQTQQMQEQTQQMEERIMRKLHQESQKSMNRSRRSNANPIEALVRVSDGQTPREQQPQPLWFPGDQNELLEATRAQLDPLLQFYDLSTEGTLSVKRRRLQSFLAVTL